MSARAAFWCLPIEALSAHVHKRAAEGSTAVVPFVRPALAEKALAPVSTRRRLSFKGYDDFMPAFAAAREAARAAFGPKWVFNPDACCGARVPKGWVSWRTSAASGSSPRDLTHFPLGHFWPGGVLPVGPEYAAPVSVAQFAAPPPRRRLTIEATDWELVADAAD